MTRNSVSLLQYSGYLLVAALASVFYNAATGEAGYNAHGITGLASCGGAAVLSAVLGILTGKGQSWAAWVGLTLSFVLFAFGGHKVFDILRDLDASALDIYKKRAAEGITENGARNAAIYRAGIFGFMMIVSLLTFLKLGLSLRHGKTA